MTTPTRNGPCPCGSAIKYKKCCLARDEAGSAAKSNAHIVQHRGATMVASRGISGRALDEAAEYFGAKRRGDGPAAKMVRFAQPLLDVAGDDSDRRQRALNYGLTFWSLAVCREAKREELLADMTDGMGEEGEKFRSLAIDMIQRHQEMFPEMHRGRS